MKESSLKTLLKNPHPIVMGILNATPNSFSDGNDYFTPSMAIDRAYEMAEEGATIIDIGAESSNPKAQPITAQEEIARLTSIVKTLIKNKPALISIDTYHPETMLTMADFGVDIINDINGFRNIASINAVKNSDVSLVVMHLDNPIETMHIKTEHEDITHTLIHYFNERSATLNEHGIRSQRIITDPGFGFGKTDAEQVELLQNLDKLVTLPYPLLVGLSRKKLIGTLTDVDVAKNRTAGSVAVTLWCLQKQAKIFRVHDVKETVEAFKLWQQLV